MRRRRNTRHSHHWASSRDASAASRPDSGIHWGWDSRRISAATSARVSALTSEAATSMRERMMPEASDMYATPTGLPIRWFTRARSFRAA